MRSFVPRSCKLRLDKRTTSVVASTRSASGRNQYRSIILARAGTFWVYEYLFAKQDRANIDDDELVEFRKLAKAYGGLTAHQVNRLLQDQDWMEICNGNQA